MVSNWSHVISPTKLSISHYLVHMSVIDVVFHFMKQFNWFAVTMAWRREHELSVAQNVRLIQAQNCIPPANFSAMGRMIHQVN